jgi:hypothetical protein
MEKPKNNNNKTENNNGQINTRDKLIESIKYRTSNSREKLVYEAYVHYSNTFRFYYKKKIYYSHVGNVNISLEDVANNDSVQLQLFNYDGKPVIDPYREPQHKYLEINLKDAVLKTKHDKIIYLMVPMNKPKGGKRKSNRKKRNSKKSSKTRRRKTKLNVKL